MLHWSTCNADSQRMFLARICRHVTLLNRFQKLATRCSTANIAKNLIFRATSYHCKLALQVDQCNTTFSKHLCKNEDGDVLIFFREINQTVDRKLYIVRISAISNSEACQRTKTLHNNFNGWHQNFERISFANRDELLKTTCLQLFPVVFTVILIACFIACLNRRFIGTSHFDWYQGETFEFQLWAKQVQLSRQKPDADWTCDQTNTETMETYWSLTDLHGYDRWIPWMANVVNDIWKSSSQPENDTAESETERFRVSLDYRTVELGNFQPISRVLCVLMHG